VIFKPYYYFETGCAAYVFGLSAAGQTPGCSCPRKEHDHVEDAVHSE